MERERGGGREGGGDTHGRGCTRPVHARRGRGCVKTGGSRRSCTRRAHLEGRAQDLYVQHGRQGRVLFWGGDDSNGLTRACTPPFCMYTTVIQAGHAMPARRGWLLAPACALAPLSKHEAMWN
eukprot:361427-Chlamydomonas_euryale.AAC.4